MGNHWLFVLGGLDLLAAQASFHNALDIFMYARLIHRLLRKVASFLSSEVWNLELLKNVSLQLFGRYCLSSLEDDFI